MIFKTGLGQDSHQFDANSDSKLILAGVEFDDAPPLKGNSDADVVLHAVTNSISSITGRNILGEIADRMCLKQGITDSKEYLKLAYQDLSDWRITHLAISIECYKPRITPHIDTMKKSLAQLLKIDQEDIGITATSGEGLTAFGKGKGIQVMAILTVIKKEKNSG
ncbi:MAG: 2-C-methyl-D-erythritol 2,4-cyclodiphosphate synthase [Candidatus Marinimicrobia bacterium]|nr:2-C-methyl-D-erythritol 2,4-cyclodiphosphate synthase [Candidatus Neomarinimicrobiota bacterium]